MYRIQRQTTIEQFIFPFGALDPGNRWVRLADEVPWEELEARYAAWHPPRGRPAKPIRLLFGCLVVKEVLDCTDRETLAQAAENPYIQYFLGGSAFEQARPVGLTTLTDFRRGLFESDRRLIRRLARNKYMR